MGGPWCVQNPDIRLNSGISHCCFPAFAVYPELHALSMQFILSLSHAIPLPTDSDIHLALRSFKVLVRSGVQNAPPLP